MDSKQHKKELGQYFTTSPELQEYVFSKVKHKLETLLEPSFGAGHLLTRFKEYDTNYPIECYEIDKTITPVIEFNKFQKATYADFTEQHITKKYKTVVGNPPYVKKTSGNLYIRFIELCFECLDDTGEMIFIVPSVFFKATSASSIIQKMVQEGSFTDIWFPHNEKLFDKASIDVVVFRYEKGIHTRFTLVNGEEKACNVSNGIITFHSREDIPTYPIHEKFHVYVGMVSGRDEILRTPIGNMKVLTDKGKEDTFVFAQTFPTNNPEIDDYLRIHKDELIARKIRKFTEDNWFQWGAPRNITIMKNHFGKRCIYVKTITRSKEVAFEGTVQYFGGTLLCLVPKEKMEEKEIKKMVEYLNSTSFREAYLYAGRFKIGHKQISYAMVHV